MAQFPLLNMCILLHLNGGEIMPDSHIKPLSSSFYEVVPQWPGSCILPSCLPPEARLGDDLTISYGYTAVMPTATAKKKKRSLMPLLVVVFSISYALMTMLIVEQGSAIQSQHNLITVLMRDSRELWASKGKAIEDKQAQVRAHEQAPVVKEPARQAPAGNAAAPTAKHHTQSQAKAAKPDVGVPPAPAADLLDRRRSLTTI